MNLSLNAQATLLLTSHFSKLKKDDVKPLTNTEWGRITHWMIDKNLTPADFMQSNSSELLEGWSDKSISHERVLTLLERGHSFAIALEKWQRAGLWVITRSDKSYPKRLKARLKMQAPPVLFGCGNVSLLNSGGLAVIGSRNAGVADLAFTRELGIKLAVSGIPVISGGARGVDETSMLGSIAGGGACIGVMADSLLKACSSGKWRNALMDNQAVLVSPFYPEAGFNVGNAMARNKYIYCLSDSSLVIHSGKKGGTLNGAKENLKKAWVPLWVKPTKDVEAANFDLVEKGGHWCEGNVELLNVDSFFISPGISSGAECESLQLESLSVLSSDEKLPSRLQVDLFGDECINLDSNIKKNPKKSEAPKELGNSEAVLVREHVNFYQLFINEIACFAKKPVSIDKFCEELGLHKPQVKIWLDQAIEDGLVKKINRPVRYQILKNMVNSPLNNSKS
ncbi:Putative DNA processing chain A [hydrothermal vent metagenome]|uniref:DNA processing chain A n=1 Tax=hydrothermal vent metagenome TaxID=652676 RepID=A0A3B0WSQ7_9ZZZZ